METNLRRYIINKEMVMEAINLVMPVIESTGGKKAGIWIVVSDPNIQMSEEEFEDAILLEYEVGESTNDRRINAKGKAKFSWETGLYSKEASKRSISLITGDCVWGGSSVLELNPDEYFVVAVSGLKEFEDEFISTLIIDAIKMFVDKYVLDLKNSGKPAIVE